MSAEREVYLAALELPNGEARSSYLDEACDDADMRQRIEKMLAFDADDTFLSDNDLDPVDSDGALKSESLVGTTIGPYSLRQVIGEGGFGVVYSAEQTQPVSRTVALKLIKPGMDSREIVRRFEAERKTLAQMDHPHIARFLDVGATKSGSPYFVMELVEGKPITEFCDDQRLTTQQRLNLFTKVCAALQHAHQKGIIHRDIKPTNVLVTPLDGVPVPKVIDFGVAKAIAEPLSAKSMFTQAGQVIGTPQYMSPEQAGLEESDVDTRSDVYSLGVLLYELLTGVTPLDPEQVRAKSFHEMLRAIREDEPTTPSSRVSTISVKPEGDTVSSLRRTDPARLRRALQRDLTGS